MTLHLAVKLSDDARHSTFDPALARHGTVHWCGSVTALEAIVAAGAAVAVLDLGGSEGAEAGQVLARLRHEYPALVLIVAYDPAGEELTEAARLARRGLGLWFACEPDGELDLLLANSASGAAPASPTPAELAVRCTAELSLPPAALRFALFHGLTPAIPLDETAAAARCGEKLRTVQRQFADIGVTASAVRRAFQTLHAAFWLRGNGRDADRIALTFGRPSARALRDGMKDVLGLGVQELRRAGEVEALCSAVVSRLRSVRTEKRRRRRKTEKPRVDARRYRLAPRVSVSLAGDTIIARLKGGTRWALTDVTGAVLVEVVLGRSLAQIVTRIQRDYRRTHGEARAAVDAALLELSARGAVELDQDRFATLPL